MNADAEALSRLSSGSQFGQRAILQETADLGASIVSVRGQGEDGVMTQ